MKKRSKIKTFLYSYEDWGGAVFVIVRSAFVKVARNKVVSLTSDFEKPLKNWKGIVLNEETEKMVMETHKLNTLYYA